MRTENRSLADYDPTGSVNLRDPAAVALAISAILDRRYGSHDRLLLQRCVTDLVNCYRGKYRGLLACDTKYHDLRHVLETGLTMARLIDGDCELGGRDGPPLDAEQAMFGICMAFFHDVGLLRRENEPTLWGATLLPIHEERGVEFLNGYLKSSSLIDFSGKAELIMPTKLTFHIPEEWAQPDRKLASMIASADLMSQMADRCYLEKCRDFLFLEFTAIGLAGTADSPYPDPVTLLQKTPGFVKDFARNRLALEFNDIFESIKAHFNGVDPYQEAISRHLDYLVHLLGGSEFGRLRRKPQPFIEELAA